MCWQLGEELAPDIHGSGLLPLTNIIQQESVNKVNKRQSLSHIPPFATP